MTEKAYLIVFKADDKHYIQLTKNDSEYYLRAFETQEKAFSIFEHFGQKAKSSSYESHISGSMGIMNLSPHIIEVDKNNPTMIHEFITNQKAMKLTGGIFGAHIDTVGIEVNDDILKLSVCDVANVIISDTYNKQQ